MQFESADDVTEFEADELTVPSAERDEVEADPEPEVEEAPAKRQTAEDVEALFRACDPSWTPASPPSRYEVERDDTGLVRRVRLASADD